MQPPFWERWLEHLRGLPPAWLAAAGGVLVGLLVVLLVWRVLAGRRAGPVRPVVDLTIDVSALGQSGPPPGPPALEYRNLPVRLAAVVLAPAGRVQEVPADAALSAVYEALVPGLAGVVALHRPLVCRWPAQLSTRGFAHLFFQHVRLPGEGGRGTAWCSAAGVMKLHDQPLMVGLVMRTQSATSLGQAIVVSAEQWLDLLRVRQV